MKIFIKPIRRVLGPDGEPVPDGGMEVERDAFWLRRLHDGDVVIEEAE